jgi:hypothetical protein
MSKKDPFKSLQEKRLQREGRKKSELAGTRGRKDHKGKAASSNKYMGGKAAR